MRSASTSAAVSASGPARHVQEHPFRADQVELARTNQPVRVRRERRAQDDVVALARAGRPDRPARPTARLRARRGPRASGQHAHAEGRQPPDRLAADAARADDADRAAGHGHALELRGARRSRPRAPGSRPAAASSIATTCSATAGPYAPAADVHTRRSSTRPRSNASSTPPSWQLHPRHRIAQQRAQVEHPVGRSVRGAVPDDRIGALGRDELAAAAPHGVGHPRGRRGGREPHAGGVGRRGGHGDIACRPMGTYDRIAPLTGPIHDVAYERQSRRCRAGSSASPP